MFQTICFAVLLLFLCSACSLFSSDDRTEFREFIAHVDSISVPFSVHASDTMIVRFHGWLGHNSCYAFARFEALRAPAKIELQVIGIVVSQNMCLDVMVPLPDAFAVTPPLVGPFEVIFRQPDKSALRRVVEVSD